MGQKQHQRVRYPWSCLVLHQVLLAVVHSKCVTGVFMQFSAVHEWHSRCTFGPFALPQLARSPGPMCASAQKGDKVNFEPIREFNGVEVRLGTRGLWWGGSRIHTACAPRCVSHAHTHSHTHKRTLTHTHTHTHTHTQESQSKGAASQMAVCTLLPVTSVNEPTNRPGIHTGRTVPLFPGKI